MPSRNTLYARRALAFGSYGVLAAIVLGYIDLIPAVDRSIEEAGRAGQVGVGVALAAYSAAPLVCWVRRVDRTSGSRPPARGDQLRRGILFLFWLCRVAFGHPADGRLTWR